MKNISNFFYIVSNNKSEIFLVLVLTILMSIFEIIGIALIVSFLTIIVNPELIEANKILNLFKINKLIFFFNIENIINFISFSILVILFLRFVIQVISNYFIFKITSNKENYLRKKIIDIFIKTSFSELIKKDSSELINYVSNHCSQFSNVFFHFLKLINNFVFIFILSFTLIIVNAKLFIFLLIIILILFVINYFFLKDFFKAFGIMLNSNSEAIYKKIKEVFTGIKELLVYQKLNVFFNEIKTSSNLMALSKIRYNSLLGLVRYSVEFFLAISIVFIILFIEYLKNYQNTTQTLEEVSIFGIAAIRLLPLLHGSMSSLNAFNFSSEILSSIKEVLVSRIHRDNLISNNLIKLEKFKKIKFSNINFSFDKKKILENVNFEIEKGEIIGIEGESGAGKTTLANIFTGLLKPSSGKIYYNDRLLDAFDSGVLSLRNKVAYLTQDVFIFNDTLEKNITLNLDENNKKIDKKKLIDALNFASLHDFLGDNFKVDEQKLGEDGKKISGGQKQRIALARAFYANREIIILDEFTSSLDEMNEKLIMESIKSNNNNLAYIIISHKLSTLKYCTKNYKVREKNLILKK